MSLLLLLMLSCCFAIFLRLGLRLFFGFFIFLALAFLFVLARRMRTRLLLLLSFLRLLFCRLFMFDRLLLDLGLRFLFLVMLRRVRTLWLFCGFSFLPLFVFF